MWVLTKINKAYYDPEHVNIFKDFSSNKKYIKKYYLQSWAVK